jgi:hypothetical protein
MHGIKGHLSVVVLLGSLLQQQIIGEIRTVEQYKLMDPAALNHPKLFGRMGGVPAMQYIIV